jgi:hypothetical protein
MIDTHIQGIPCQVEMTGGHYVKPWQGSAYNCPSDWDYYGGWFDVEFEIYDRKGYRAKWLEKKMTAADEQRIIEELTQDRENDDY